MEYYIPPRLDEKEKIVGGFMTFSQLIVLGVGVAVAFIMTSILISILPIGIVVVLGLFPITVAVIVAFVPIGRYSVVTYIYFLYKYKKRNHFLPNVRSEKVFSEIKNDNDEEDELIKM